MISIKAYRESSFSEEVRYCENENHKSEPVTIGCKICWVILCPLCISTSKHCPSGEFCFITPYSKSVAYAIHVKFVVRSCKKRWKRIWQLAVTFITCLQKVIRNVYILLAANCREVVYIPYLTYRKLVNYDKTFA